MYLTSSFERTILILRGGTTFYFTFLILTIFVWFVLLELCFKLVNQVSCLYGGKIRYHATFTSMNIIAISKARKKLLWPFFKKTFLYSLDRHWYERKNWHIITQPSYVFLLSRVDFSLFWFWYAPAQQSGRVSAKASRIRPTTQGFFPNHNLCSMLFFSKSFFHLSNKIPRKLVGIWKSDQWCFLKIWERERRTKPLEFNLKRSERRGAKSTKRPFQLWP